MQLTISAVKAVEKKLDDSVNYLDKKIDDNASHLGTRIDDLTTETREGLGVTNFYR